MKRYPDTDPMAQEPHFSQHMEAMKDFSAPNVVLQFDLNRSGAGMAWTYFNKPNITPPMFIEYVEDRDLWRFKLPCSKAINAYLGTIPYTFEAYDELDSGKRGTFGDWVSRGETVIAKQAKYVQEASKNAFPITFLGHKAIAVNACQVDVSELMHSLLERWPPNYLFAVAFWVLNDKRMTFGFRSRSGGFDVSDLAKGLGGGGHPQAAGAQLEMRQALQLLGFV